VHTAIFVDLAAEADDAILWPLEHKTLADAYPNCGS
jgi:hypothetical protein